MNTNYKLYRVFYHVAITLSFSGAFKQLSTPQSIVSQSVKVLEKKLDQSLFIRSIKKVQLTPGGEILLKHIEPAVNLIKKGENRLLEVHTLNGGQLHIGTSDAVCRYYLVPYLNRFHRKFSNIHIKVIDQASIEHAKFLENGQADSIVANYPNSALAGSMNTRIIDEFHDVFVTSRGTFPLEGFRMSLEELLRYPIMMLDRKSATSEFLHQVFQRSQLDLVPEIELSSNDLLIDLVHIGLGIAFAPGFCIPQSDEELFILDLKERLPSHQMMVVYNGSLPVFQAARQFVDILWETSV